MLHNVKEQRRTLNHFVSLSTVISGVPLFWKYEGDQQLETKVVGASGTHLNILVQKIVPTRLLSSLLKHYFNYGHVVTKQGKYFRK